MDYNGYGGWNFGWFGHVISTIVGGLLSFFVLLVIAGLVFLFVRFLLVATTAAKLYVAKNSPPKPVAVAPTPGPTAPAAPATSSVVEPTTPAPPAATPSTRPPTKPRTPKSPPTATPPTPPVVG